VNDKRNDGMHRIVIVLLCTLILLSGCATHYESETYSDPYGFFSGLWHGFIFVYSIIAVCVSWVLSHLGIEFLNSIEIIGRPNTGFFYYLGFVLGLFSVLGSGR